MRPAQDLRVKEAKRLLTPRQLMLQLNGMGLPGATEFFIGTAGAMVGV
jgi:hypothetical protein